MHTRNFDVHFIGLCAVHYSWCLIGLMVAYFVTNMCVCTLRLEI